MQVQKKEHIEIFDCWVKNARSTGRPPRSICTASCLLFLIIFQELLTVLPLPILSTSFFITVPLPCPWDPFQLPQLYYIFFLPPFQILLLETISRGSFQTISLALSTYSRRIKVQRTQPKKKASFWFTTQALSSISLNDTSRAGLSLTNFRSQEHTHLSV